MARIKEVTRRRRITTPAPGGPGSKVDPNAIAGYLDNALPPDALADVESLALASDVHLAEIAACHQILTIVLGEPARVPPTAHQRMYGLVKPPESSRQHQPPPPRGPAEVALTEGKEVDETLRFGLPALAGRGNWTNRMVLIGGAVCIVALLLVAIWQLWPGKAATVEGENVALVGGTSKKLPARLPVAQKNGSQSKPNAEPAKKDSEPMEKITEPDKQPEIKEKPAEQPKESEKKDQPAEAKEAPPAEKEKLADAEPTPAAPNTAEKELGHFEPPTPPGVAVLLQLLPDKKQPDRKHWTRLLRTKEPAKVVSNVPLLSLPGYHSVVELDSGVRLTLWGNVREIWPFPIAVESLVTLHPSDQFDLDLTLVRGRIAVFNTKDKPAKVRLRFVNPSAPKKTEIWDLTLQDKGTEVIINLAGILLPGEQFYTNKDDPKRLGPIAGVTMLAHTGKAELKIDQGAPEQLVPPPAGPLLTWNSRVGKPTPFKVDQMPEWVQPVPPLPKEADPKARAAVLAALASLNLDLSGPTIDTGLVKAAASNDLQKRRLVVRAAGAMDDLQRVITALEDKELEVRRCAIETLRIWIAADRDNDYVLYQQLQPSYTSDDAQIVMSLVHRWSPEEDTKMEFRETLVSYLTHKKPAIRELAHDYLLTLPGLYQIGSKIGYNAMAPNYMQLAKEWQKVVQQGK
jgi:hypothetical protein